VRERAHFAHSEGVLGFRGLLQVQEKNGSSGRTRTYNPPVNSCTKAKTALCRLLRWLLITHHFMRFQELLSTADFEGDSLKKSPKYFPATWAASTGAGSAAMKR
jgi:hypothetical protein